jgi:hypothetical protein
MKSSTALIGTAAAAAVLVAGSVAAMAAVNTAASSASTIKNVSVVADQPTAAGSLAPIQMAPLPEIVRPEAAEPVIVDAVDTTSAAPSSVPSAKSGSASPKPKVQSSATPMSQQARSMSADKAAAIVTGQVDGKATVTDVSRVQHAGYDSWAVTVDKADGSRLVGYVFTGATGNDVFDWKVLKEPTPVVVTIPSPSASTNLKPGHGDHENESHDFEHSGSSHGSEHDDD